MNKNIINVSSEDIKTLNDVMAKVINPEVNGNLSPEDIKVAKCIVDPLFAKLRQAKNYLDSKDKQYEQLQLQLENEEKSTVYVKDSYGYEVKGFKRSKTIVNTKAFHKHAQPKVTIDCANSDFQGLDIFHTTARFSEKKIIDARDKGLLPSCVSNEVKDISYVEVTLFDDVDFKDNK